jgi:hypothetical protein
MVHSEKEIKTINDFIDAYYSAMVDQSFSRTNDHYQIDRWLLADVVHLLLKERRLSNNAYNQ